MATAMKEECTHRLKVLVTGPSNGQRSGLLCIFLFTDLVTRLQQNKELYRFCTPCIYHVSQGKICMSACDICLLIKYLQYITENGFYYWPGNGV